MKRPATLLLAAAALTACTTSPPVAETRPHSDVASLVSAVTRAIDEQKTYRFTITPPTTGGVRPPAHGAVKLGEVPSLDATTTRAVQSGGKEEQLRFVSTTKDTAFVSLPPVFGLPADKPWMKLTRADTDEFTNTLLGYHDVIYQQAVFTTYHLPVIAAGGTVRLTAQIGNSTRYSIAVDYQKAFDTLTDEKLRNEIKLALDQNVTSSTGEIELDNRGLPVRITFSTQFQNALIVDEARFSDWGTAVTITEPSPTSVSQRN